MMPRINPMKLPKRLFKEICFNPFSIRRVKAARRSPAINPKRGIGGEAEISWVKVYPLIPQITNNRIRRIHEPNAFTSFPWLDDMRRHSNKNEWQGIWRGHHPKIELISLKISVSFTSRAMANSLTRRFLAVSIIFLSPKESSFSSLRRWRSRSTSAMP